HAWIGLAKITLGRAEETEAHVAEAFRISPSDGAAFLWTHIEGLAKLQLGRQGEAEAEVKFGLDIAPGFSVRRFRAGAESDNPVYLAQRDRVMEGMRK